MFSKLFIKYLINNLIKKVSMSAFAPAEGLSKGRHFPLEKHRKSAE